MAGAAVPFDLPLAELCWGIGLSLPATAGVLLRSVSEVEYRWSVFTGLPVGNDPSPELLEERRLEVEAGWTAEQREQARLRVARRESSAVVRGTETKTRGCCYA